MRDDTVKRRWLWSIDIRGTELWLADLEAKGFRLTHLDAKSSKFVFEKAEPRYATLMIRYKQESLGDNWTEAASDGHWQIVRTTMLPNETLVFDTHYDLTDRKTIITRNSKLMTVWVFSLLIAFFVIAYLTQALSMMVGQEGTALVQALLYTLTTALILTFIIGTYLCFHLQARTQEIRPEGLDRDSAVRRKFFFIGRVSYPENLARWLEDQEADGWKLYSCNKSLTRFSFERAEPATASYSLQKVDGDDIPKPKPGWEHVKSGTSVFYQWIIQRAYYDPALEQKPRYESSTTEVLRQEKRRMQIRVVGAMISLVPLGYFFTNMLILLRTTPPEFVGSLGVFTLCLNAAMLLIVATIVRNLVVHYARQVKNT